MERKERSQIKQHFYLRQVRVCPKPNQLDKKSPSCAIDLSIFKVQLASLDYEVLGKVSPLWDGHLGILHTDMLKQQQQHLPVWVMRSLLVEARELDEVGPLWDGQLAILHTETHSNNNTQSLTSLGCEVLVR